MVRFSLSNVMDIDLERLYAVKFCSILPDYVKYFTAVGMNSASIFRIGENVGGVELVQAYQDSDNDENYYAATWTDKGDSVPLLAIAGKRGIIKVINTISLEVVAALTGHGNEILDIITHSVDTNLVISGSRDESVRLWNIKSETCVAIFAGEKGHRNDVLSVAMHPCGNVLASSGMDNTIKLWNLVSTDISEAISKSYNHDEHSVGVTTVPVIEQFPIFSTDKVHNNYVDCVKWVGDLILSKSLCNRAVLWTPDPLRAKDAVCILREFSLSHSKIWFMKMSVCDVLYSFAAGNSHGKVELFHITPPCEVEESKAASAGFLSEIEKSKKPDQRYYYERFETGIGSKPNATIWHESSIVSNIRDSDFSLGGDCFIYCSSEPQPATNKSTICIWHVEDALRTS